MSVKIKAGTEADADIRKDSGILVAEEKRTETDGKKKFFELRSIWSGWLIFWISTLIIFNVSLTFAVGMGALNFKEYQWFVVSVTVQTFLQIVGMGYVAVRFLFNEKAGKDKTEKTA